MADVRTSEPASEKDEEKLECPVVPGIHSLCHGSSQRPSAGGKATSPCLRDGPNHVICIGQWDVSRLDAADMDASTCICASAVIQGDT